MTSSRDFEKVAKDGLVLADEIIELISLNRGELSVDRHCVLYTALTGAVAAYVYASIDSTGRKQAVASLVDGVWAHLAEFDRLHLSQGEKH